MDGRLLRGERTRQAVLDTAIALASVDGLDGLSLNRLAQALGVSKSGLFAHWADKQELQLAIVEHAREQWITEIVTPAMKAPRGLRRLWALHEERLAFYASGALPGTCFFGSVQSEFDDRPGPVHDAVMTAVNEWIALLTGAARRAIDSGDLRPDADPDQIAFEVQAIGAAVVVLRHLPRDESTFRHARRAVLDRLRALATDPAILPES